MAPAGECTTQRQGLILPAGNNDSSTKQRVLVLYLRSSTLDSEVIGWALYDGNAPYANGPGEQDEPPYKTGIQALADGWRLFQASPLLPARAGQEFQTDYLKYEFFFEQLVNESN